MDNAANIAVDSFMKNIRPRLFPVLRGKKRREMLADKHEVITRYAFLQNEYLGAKLHIPTGKNAKTYLRDLAIQQLASEKGESARKSARFAFRRRHPKSCDVKPNTSGIYFEEGFIEED